MKEALLAHFSDIPMKERYVPSRVGPPILRSSFSEARFRHNFRVLVPGAGLGRLAYEVAKLGERISLSFDSATEPTASLRIFLPRQRVFALHAVDLVLHSQSVCTSPPIPALLSTILNLLPCPKDAASKPAHDLPLRPHALQRARPRCRAQARTDTRRPTQRSASGIQLFPRRRRFRRGLRSARCGCGPG
jgi:hypothetical protein